jgi:hypothetical protein
MSCSVLETCAQCYVLTMWIIVLVGQNFEILIVLTEFPKPLALQLTI